MQQARKKPFLKQLHREGANDVLLAPALIYTLIFGYFTYGKPDDILDCCTAHR